MSTCDSGNDVLMSIRPHYAEMLFTGDKTVELRRRCPRLDIGDRIYVYVTSPVRSLCGCLTIDRIEKACPTSLWRIVRTRAGVVRAEFDAYFSGARIGYGIFVRGVIRYQHPVSLERLQAYWPGFHPPRTHSYRPMQALKKDGLLG